MSRSEITALLVQGIALALLVLMIATAPGVAAGCVLLSGSPALQRLLIDHRQHAETRRRPIRIDRGRGDR
jgi:hypothetical protein